MQNEDEKAKLFSALCSITEMINSNYDYLSAIKDILEIICTMKNWQIGHAYVVQENLDFESINVWYTQSEEYAAAKESLNTSLTRDEGVPGQVVKRKAVLWTYDFDKDIPVLPRRPYIEKFGLHTIIAFPVIAGDQIDAIVECFCNRKETEDVLFMKFLSQCGILLGRLFERYAYLKKSVKQENILSAILTTSPNAIIVIDENSTILEWSDKGESIFGYKKCQVLQKKLYDVIMSPFYKDKHIQGINNYKKHHKKSKLIGGDPILLTAMHKDGHEFPILLSVNESMLLDGKSLFIGFVQDLTETEKQQIAYERMERTLNYFKTMWAHVPAAVGVVETDLFKYIFSNKRLDILLQNSEEVAGRSVEDSFISQTVFEMMYVVKTVAQTGKTSSFRDVKISSSLYIDISFVKFFIEEKSYVLIFANDVTESVISKQKLGLSMKRLQSVLKTMGLLLWQVGHDGSITMWEGDASMIQQKQNVTVGQDHKKVFEKYQSIIKDIESVKASSIPITRDFEFSGTFYRIYYQRFTQDQVMGILMNVDQIKKLEQEKTDLRIREQTALEKSKLQSEFLMNMSHEIRTPINGIVGIIELLQDTQLSQMQSEYIVLIEQSLQLLQSIINQIFDISRIESGQVNVVSKCIKVEEVISTVSHVYEISAKAKGLSFKCSLSENLSDLFVMIDKDKLSYSLSNLLGNAVKFTETGTIILYVSYENEYLICKVIDTGIGIKEEEQSKIFLPFQQLDKFSTKRFPGTGLGLYIISKMVSLMGGDVKVNSTYGKGSEFVVKIPTKICIPQENSNNKQSLENKKILVVEDNIINRRVLVTLLKKHKVMVDECENGELAVTTVKSHSQDYYDVILMDLQMPVMDGYEATKEIRKFNKAVPILAVTANSSQEEKDHCISIGMNDYLSKPYKSQELMTMIHKFL